MIIMFDNFKCISFTHLSSCIQKNIYFSDQVFSSVLALNRVTDWENKCLVNPLSPKLT